MIYNYKDILCIVKIKICELAKETVYTSHQNSQVMNCYKQYHHDNYVD